MGTEQTETYVDKSSWPRGPWDSEPDKIEWRDEATGLPCLIVRGGMGALCGYVGVPSSHPLHGKDHDEPDVEVHGGLTYADACDDHGRICHVPKPGEDPNAWWFGFDCGHCGDRSPRLDSVFSSSGVYRDIAYVRHETEQLARQLAAMAPTKP